MKLNNISFRGYNNILCAFDSTDSNAKYVASMSMQLNDEDGVSDLTEYKKLKYMQSSVANPSNDDVLTITYVIDKTKNTEHIYLNTKEMYFGDELRYIGEKYVPKIMSQENYKLEETLHMKAYTLLASLTRRLMYAPFNKENENLSSVIISMYNTLSRVFNDEKSAFRITELAGLKKYKFQDFAEGLNKRIDRTMKLFFR